MTFQLHDPRTAPLPPAIIGAALDCLAVLPDGDRLAPATLTAIARAIGCAPEQSTALAVRIRAAATILNDPQWRPWSTYHKALPRAERPAFDNAFLTIVAELPLNSDLRFPAHLFFRALLHFVAVGRPH